MLTVIAKRFRGKHFPQLHDVGVLQLLPHVHHLHAFGRLETETYRNVDKNDNEMSPPSELECR